MTRPKSAHEERQRILTQPHKRPYGSRVRVHLTDENSLGYLDRASVLLTDGTVLRTSKSDIAPWIGGVAYELSVEGFLSAGEAEVAGSKLTTAVLWTCISLDVAARLDYGTLHPARVFDRTQTPGLQLSSYGTVGWPTSKVVNELVTSHSSLNEVPPGLALSMEIFAGAKMEVSERARFVSTVSALELLADPASLGPQTAEFVFKSLELLKAQNAIDAGTKKSLEGRLLHLKKESIRQALHRLVRENLPRDTDAKEVVDRAYALRSELVHSGKLSDANVDLFRERVEITRVIRELYASRLERPLAKKNAG